MHNLLDNYLQDVRKHLQPLPSTRREAEMREVQAHLENALAAGRERGLSEDEAARDALQQFGLPETVGQDVVAAWRREKRLNTRSFWGAVSCAWGLLLVFGMSESY